MSLVGLIKGRRGENGFGYASTAEEVTEGLDLSGKTIVITGVNSGIGQESARVLAMRGAHIIGLARTDDKAALACEALPGDATPVACELSDPKSVRAAATKISDLGVPLDVLLCNAGIMALPQRELVHGQEKQFFTNHIGHFILVTGLLDALSETGRVVMLSSAAHGWAPEAGIQFDDLSFEYGYNPTTAYGQSKLANLLFARALARRLEGGKTSNGLHPGSIGTNLARHMNIAIRALMPVFNAVALKTVPQGAATQCYVAVHPDMKVTGEYFADCNLAKSSRHRRNEAMAERLWEVSEEIVNGL
jgi:NAD(P)-dependent dehydrogenase (short-subunit alcohol dehydrogenase family)